MSTIPASQIVNVIPNVLSPGGTALQMNGVLLTTSERVPIGSVLQFATAADVGAYFGLNSLEYDLAGNYFNGFVNSNVKPDRVYFAQYNTTDVEGYLRGGSLSGMTLTELKALTPATLTITVAGSGNTSASIDLSGATSFSNAASIIQAAFTLPDFAVTYDSVSAAFVFTTSSAGVAETITYAASGGALNASLKLTEATGAVLSQGADASTPNEMMALVVNQTTNWATFMNCQDPDSTGVITNKLAFAEWASDQNGRYGYVAWDTDTGPSASSPDTGSLGYAIQQASYGGTYLLGCDTSNSSVPASPQHAAFICGSGASIDFNETNGRITFAFKRQDGLSPTCTNATAAQNLIANGYNFYGAYATANDDFVWNYPGKVSGDELWFDSFINAIWLVNQFQLAFMVLLDNTKSIPYNQFGYSLIKAACLDVINQGLNFGAFRAGVMLSESQKAEVNAAAGLKVDDALYQNGWYLQVKDANPQTRVARQSPPIKFWYMDGQSVQMIDMTAINVQ